MYMLFIDYSKSYNNNLITFGITKIAIDEWIENLDCRYQKMIWSRKSLGITIHYILK
jgi:hypothetical protein